MPADSVIMGVRWDNSGPGPWISNFPPPWGRADGPPMSCPDYRSVGLALLLAGRYGWRSTNGASAPRKRRSRWVAQAAKGAGGKGWDRLRWAEMGWGDGEVEPIYFVVFEHGCVEHVSYLNIFEYWLLRFFVGKLVCNFTQFLSHLISFNWRSLQLFQLWQLWVKPAAFQTWNSFATWPARPHVATGHGDMSLRTTIDYNKLITLQQRSQNWQNALHLLERICAVRLQPTLISPWPARTAVWNKISWFIQVQRLRVFLFCIFKDFKGPNLTPCSVDGFFFVHAAWKMIVFVCHILLMCLVGFKGRGCFAIVTPSIGWRVKSSKAMISPGFLIFPACFIFNRIPSIYSPLIKHGNGQSPVNSHLNENWEHSLTEGLSGTPCDCFPEGKPNCWLIRAMYPITS